MCQFHFICLFDEQFGAQWRTNQRLQSFGQGEVPPVPGEAELLGKPDRIASGGSPGSLRAFVSTKTIGDWQSEHSLADAVIRRELDLVRAALEQRLESQTHTMLMLDEALHQQPDPAISDARMEAEVTGLQPWLGGSGVGAEDCEGHRPCESSGGRTAFGSWARYLCL
jgi:hypothetical protein